MEEKKKFDLKKFALNVASICTAVAWIFIIVGAYKGIVTPSMIGVLLLVTAFTVILCIDSLTNPLFDMIEKLEDDKLELQAKVEQMKIDMKKKSSKTTKSDD